MTFLVRGLGKMRGSRLNVLFDQMRKLEQQQAHLWSSTRNTRQDVPFVRVAKAGGWKSGLSDASVAEIEGAWGHLMQFLGYDLTTTKGRHSGSLSESLLVGPGQ